MDINNKIEQLNERYKDILRTISKSDFRKFNLRTPSLPRESFPLAPARILSRGLNTLKLWHDV